MFFKPNYIKKSSHTHARIMTAFCYLHCDSFLTAELVKQIDGIDFFGNITHQKVDIVLRNLQTTVTEKPRKGYHIATVNDPLSCKGMAVSMNAGGLNAAPFVVL